MSYNNYLQAIELINKNPHLSRKIYPQSGANITNAEEILNINFPRSYRDFLSRYGIFDIMGSEVYGLDYISDYNNYIYYNIICNTLDERKINIDPPFPEAFVPIYDLGNGEKICLNTAQINSDEECPIVLWNFGNIESIENEFGKDFGEFFFKIIKKGLKRAEEEGKVVNW